MNFDDVVKQMTDRGATQITIVPTKDGKIAVGAQRNGVTHGDAGASGETVALSLVPKLDEAIATEQAMAKRAADAAAAAQAAREAKAKEIADARAAAEAEAARAVEAPKPG